MTMALQHDVKQEIINAYQIHATDTGSADVQVAILTERIKQLSEHLKANKKRLRLSPRITENYWPSQAALGLYPSP